MTFPTLNWRDHLAENLRLAMPLIVGQLATIGIWTSDVLAMGQIDSDSLAAGALATRYFQPIFFLAIGISLAVGPLIAQGLGAGDDRQIRRSFRQGMIIAFTLGMLTIPLLFVAEPVLITLGQDPELSRLTKPFLFWTSFGLPFMFLTFVLRQFLISYQRPMPQVIAMLIALAVNVGLNEILSKGAGPIPAMGLGGIALGTSIVYFLLCVGLIGYIANSSPFRESKPFQRLWLMDWDITFRVLKIGVPIGLTIVAETGMFIAAALLIGLYGTASLAAISIANQIAAVAFMIPISMAQAGMVRIGNYAGAEDRQNLFKSATATMTLALSACTLTMIILLIWPDAMIRMFIQPSDSLFADVQALAIPMLLLTSLFQIPDGVQSVALAILRGINDTKIPGIIAIGCFWITGVGAGAIAGFTLGMGPIGVWGGVTFGLFVASGVLTIRMRKAMRRIKDGGQILMA